MTNRNSTDSESTEIQKPDLATQLKFTGDGGLEEDDTPTETSLGDWGMDVDDDDGETRIETGASDEFVDDRTVIPGQDPDDGEQEALILGTTDDAQQSLSGDDDTEYCPFENSADVGDDRTDADSAGKALTDGGNESGGDQQ